MDQCWVSIHEVQQPKLDCYILFSLLRQKVRAVFTIGKLTFSWPQNHFILKKIKQQNKPQSTKKSLSKSKS